MAKKDYNNWSKDKLIHELKQYNKLKKSFGLVWEEKFKTEEVVQKCKKYFPVLEENKEKYINTKEDCINHIFIEGDNYHALSVLNFTHEKKIDVIYIDPPYNTGNKSWRYNNNYVEKEDRFKHSKWISFMNKRLKLAKPLLKKEGIIIIAIDDYEHHTLRLLMDKLFGETNRLGTIVVIHNPGGRSDDEFIATTHEYLLIYAYDKNYARINNFNLREEQVSKFKYKDSISFYKEQSFMRTGSNSRPEDRPNLYYPIYYNPTNRILSLEKTNNDFIKILPFDSRGLKRVWRWGRKTFKERKNTEFVVSNSKNNYIVKIKKRYYGGVPSDGTKPKTFWADPKYNASSHGTILLQNILHKEKPFDYPKSLYSVIDAINISSNKDSIILDFFAGSGTTGHAVLKLNKEEKGSRRQFILCTDNQDNNGSGEKIADDICYPRLKRAIRGYHDLKNNKIAGLGGNLKYFKTSFVEKVKTDNDKRIFTNKSTELICLAENTFNEILKKDKQFAIYQNEEKTTGIIYDEDYLDDFKDKIRNYKKPITIYVFSYDNTYNEEDFADINNLIEVKPIPEAILNIYRKIYKNIL